MAEYPIPTAPFLRVPAEIRLIIYKLLLTDQDTEVLSIRNDDPSTDDRRKHGERCRSQYRIMADRFRARSMETTYSLAFNPGIFPSILGVNRMIHDEASHVLYSAHTFDFGLDVEAVIPFLSDLTPLARSSIKRINIVKRALPYSKDFDRCEWRNVCAFISKHMELVQLGLGILGGKPAIQWEATDTYKESDFDLISEIEGMEWMSQVAEIKGLQEVDVKAYLQHCPPPCSNAMTFFVNFSASIELGFAAFLKSQMLAPAF
ncbi:MAG: hypothetical protein LQ347_000114 [Umbilicaria vellea]|nr:MAG: hypothetical protein LQ347_000114 [Umbilicaria vellea]